MEKKLFRSTQNKVVAGICGGLAEYFDIDPVIVRVIFVVATFGWGFSILAYFILWIIVPVNRMPFPSEKAEALEMNDETGSFTESLNYQKNYIQSKGTSNGKIAFGVVLIVIGLIALLNNLIPEIEFKYVFPIILIIIGIAILMKIPNRNHNEKKEAL